MPEVVRVPAGPISPLARQQLVPMRDGVRLATDFYLPGGDETPGPVLLTRLPYDKNGAFTPIALFAEYLMSRGYRVVAQDVRGKFRSEGERLIWVNEASDGYDTIDWISKQPWCDGNVAMWGNSYYGFTQFAAMTMQHPALKAISPRLTGTTLGEPHVAAPGEPTRGVEWTTTYTYLLNFFHDNENVFWNIDWSSRPHLDQIREFLHEHGDGTNRSFDQWYPHAHLLRRFPNVPHPFDARPIPILFTIGWWDNCAPASWKDVSAMLARPGWANSLHLNIESIDHYSFELHSGDRAEFPSAEEWRARIPRILGPTVDFFDVYVRGLAPAASIPKVRYEVANTRGKRRAASWPPEGTRLRTLASTVSGDLKLVSVGDTAAFTGPSAARTWVHDASDPVPSAAPDPFKYLLNPGDEASLAAHEGVAVLESEPLAAELDIVGEVIATGTFASTGPNMDVFVRLYDVGPNGRLTRIARGNIHILDTSTPRTVRIGLDQAGYRVQAGHRLSVHLASSDSPEYVTQPGNGHEPWSAAYTVPNEQTVLLGGAEGFLLQFDELPVDAAGSHQTQ